MVELNRNFPEVAVADVKVADTTKTALSPLLVCLPGSLMPGDQIRLKASGIFTTAGSATGTAKLDIMGGVTDSEAILITDTSSTLTASQTSAGWELEAVITIRTITGDTDEDGTVTDGTLIGVMKINGDYQTMVATPNGVVVCASTAIETDEENSFYLAVTMSGGAADNFITCQQAAWEKI